MAAGLEEGFDFLNVMEERAGVRPGLYTFADSTNVCFQHPSNILPISYEPVPKAIYPRPAPPSDSCH